MAGREGRRVGHAVSGRDGDGPVAGPELLSPAASDTALPDMALPDPASPGLLALLESGPHGDEPLNAAEAGYVANARAANTLRGYRADWRSWSDWCAQQRYTPLPAEPVAVARYLTELAAGGARVGTMSRLLAALRFAHQLADVPSPTQSARVLAVWEGIRRTHGAPPEQSAPLAPPELLQVVDACPTTKHWRTQGRKAETSLAGARDRALLLVGFVAALRRSELVGIEVADLAEHPNGLVLTIPRSKVNQTGEKAELVAVPRAARAAYCPVAAVRQWLELAGIAEGAVFRKVTKGNRAATTALHPESANSLVQEAVRRAGIDPAPFSAHSLRAGFVTYTHRRGASDRAIAHQTRHRSLATLGQYIRIDETWEDNAATQLGF